MPCLRFPDAPPAPTQAVFDPGKHLVVTFDRPLQAGSLDASNWSWRFGNTLYSGTDAVAVDEDVVLSGAPSGAQFGADVVNYSPPPFDVVAQDAPGLPAEGFSDFPVG